MLEGETALVNALGRQMSMLKVLERGWTLVKALEREMAIVKALEILNMISGSLQEARKNLVPRTGTFLPCDR